MNPKRSRRRDFSNARHTIAAAQARGEVERPGGDRKTNVRSADNDPATHVDLGIPRQRAADMKAQARGECGKECGKSSSNFRTM